MYTVAQLYCYNNACMYAIQIGILQYKKYSQYMYIHVYMHVYIF